MLPVIHHLEICVTNLKETTAYFVDKLNFSLAYRRETDNILQNVVKTGLCYFILTKKKVNDVSSDEILSCCESCEHTRDSVFNLAFEVKDVKSFCKHYEECGGSILTVPRLITDDYGTLEFAQVKSICGNVVHTVLNKKDYSGNFLPGFQSVKCSEKDSMVDFMDHITYVCEAGQMSSIIDFYERTFRMKRFLINRQDEEKEGLIIGGNVGMRLKVMDYWRCAEVGLQCGSFGNKLSIVLAESLPGQENSHIQTFLKEHGGPGIQHVGLHTNSMVKCVSSLVERGIQFRKPPSAYFSLPGKIEEITSAGEEVEEFRKLGILIDAEADAFDSSESTGDVSDPTSDRFLLQIFTLPMFEQETFFFEIIQRNGATGFGAGNVTALAKSIEEMTRSLVES